ncbi:calcium homeostasis modulator protein 3-like [Anomaloglossus baeobatrachus]|uniref:calcium homeostasis modulator protein 3-like n=1 Tax=Anomaloglossus baeobatrachus TaxID=238106 RepID=UPI003F50A57B
MERVVKYFQSGAEAKLNIVCGAVILTSVVVFKAYEFKCPCVPGFNKPYSLMVLLAPPLIFFFVGILVSQYCGSLTIEYSRPEGSRAKNKKVLRQMFITMMIRALAPPIVWILICFLDGKLLVCGFSETLDPDQFGGFDDFPGYETTVLLAKVPCKNFDLLCQSSTRKAISRFLKFLSQGIGCITVLTLIVLGAVARFVLPLLATHETLQVRYWNKYSDMEEKCFEVMCIEHNHKLAERCVKKYFEETKKEREKEEARYDKRKFSDAQVDTLVFVEQWYKYRPPILGGDLPDHIS